MRTLTKLTEAIAETVIEVVQKKHWTMFINNTFAFSNVGLNNRKLIEDFKAVEKDLDLLDQLKDAVLEHPKVKEFGESKGGRIFDVVWMAIIYNSKAALEIKHIIEEEV